MLIHTFCEDQGTGHGLGEWFWLNLTCNCSEAVLISSRISSSAMSRRLHPLIVKVSWKGCSYCGFLLSKWSEKERKEREFKSEPTMFFYNLLSEVICHYFCHMLLFTKTDPDTMLKGTAEEWVYQEVEIILKAAYCNLLKISRRWINEQMRYWQWRGWMSG